MTELPVTWVVAMHYVPRIAALSLLLTAPIAVALLTARLPATEHRAVDVPSFDDAVKRAHPGDLIILRAGVWHGVDLHFAASGTAERPIVLRSESPGATQLTGASRLRIGGDHLHVEGLWFHNCLPKSSDIVVFRSDSQRLAHYGVLRDCAVTQDSSVDDRVERRWVSLYGTDHLVERCHFAGKTSRSALLVVWLQPEVESGRHRISRNYFGPRQRLGKNGGEIIRIGDSKTSLLAARCTVESNFFERCDGEVECISNKSCDNMYRGNVFSECQGTLTLRHGNRCLVEGNLFDGKHRANTGGIRVIGEDHRVVGNRLVALEGEEARAALCLMNAVKDPALNGYWQVQRAKIERNVVIDCRQSLVIGYADDDVHAPLPPTDCIVSDNQIVSRNHQIVFLLDKAAKIDWQRNTFWGAKLGIEPQLGIAWNEFEVSPPEAKPIERHETGVSWKITAPKT